MPSPVLHCRDDVLRMLDELQEGRLEMLAACRNLSTKQLADPVIPGTWTEVPPEPPADLAAIQTALDEAHAAAIAFLKGNPESVLLEPCRYGRDARHETVGGLYFHLVRHEIGHRAFVRFKLRALQSV
jgi:uncharacterized damage-inducible protein DinB